MNWLKYIPGIHNTPRSVDHLPYPTPEPGTAADEQLKLERIEVQKRNATADLEWNEKQLRNLAHEIVQLEAKQAQLQEARPKLQSHVAEITAQYKRQEVKFVAMRDKEYEARQQEYREKEAARKAWLKEESAKTKAHGKAVEDKINDLI